MKVRRIGRRSHDYVSTSRCCCVVTSPTWSWTTSTRRSRLTHSPTTTMTTSTTTTTTCEAAARPRRRRCWRYTLTSADRPSSVALRGWHRVGGTARWSAALCGCGMARYVRLLVVVKSVTDSRRSRVTLMALCSRQLRCFNTAVVACMISVWIIVHETRAEVVRLGTCREGRPVVLLAHPRKSSEGPVTVM